jgi:SAM-dependent methyltransferase
MRPKSPVAKAVAARRISLLDLGAFDGQRISELAKKSSRKNKRLLAVEWAKQKGLLTRRTNLKIVYGEVLNKLGRLPSESVKVITADFFFSDLKSRGMHTANVPAKEAHVDLEVAKQIHRVLVPNGRLVCVEYLGNQAFVLEVLTAAGFEWRSHSLPEKYWGKTEYLKRLGNLINSDKAAREFLFPMQIIAKKNISPAERVGRK